MTITSPIVGPTLFDDIESTPVSDAATDEERTLDQRFWEHHRARPEVYEEFRAIALDLRRRGYTRAGAKMVAEVLRWQRMMRSVDDDGLKLNNSFVSRYARLVMAREPELAGFFELRRLSS